MDCIKFAPVSLAKANDKAKLRVCMGGPHKKGLGKGGVKLGVIKSICH